MLFKKRGVNQPPPPPSECEGLMSNKNFTEACLILYIRSEINYKRNMVDRTRTVQARRMLFIFDFFTYPSSIHKSFFLLLLSAVGGTIDGHVCLVHLQMDNFRLFLRKQMDKLQTFVGTRGNGKRIKENCRSSVFCLN
jgi:hypothetical protein